MYSVSNKRPRSATGLVKAPAFARMALTSVLLLVIASVCQAQDKEKLAKQLSNPVSSLISVPFQFNFDRNIGAEDEGERMTMNLQPVVPFSLGEDWNLISRTILPVVDQQDIFPGAGDQFGLGDAVQSLFFSPQAPSESGWIWGAGPVFLLPTGTEDELSAEKWGLGPTGVALRQQGPWTYGGLFNHIWSIAGDGDRSDVNSTFLQPFITYTTPTAWTFGANLEATRDWKTDEWSVPMHMFAAKVLHVGGQLLQVGGGPRYFIESSESGPEGLGARFYVILLFPK